MASQTRAGIRGDEGYGSAGSGAARYNDAIGRAGAPPVPTLAQGGTRRGATLEGAGMSAGEEMIATGPRGPTGSALNDLLKEDFIAENCMYSYFRRLIMLNQLTTPVLRSHLSAGALNNQAAQLEDLRALKSALKHMLDSAQGTLQTNVIQ